MYEMGEVRDPMCRGEMNVIYDFINNMKHIDRPFYVVYSADVDHLVPNKINRAIKAYYQQPPKMLGILVWYVDNKLGIADFRPDLSMPFDIPIDPSILSDDPRDMAVSVAEQGKQSNLILLS